jgi:hypothetical protein
LKPTKFPTSKLTKSPTFKPTFKPETWATFVTSAELREAVFDASTAGSQCNALVYRNFGPFDAWDVSFLTDLDHVSRDFHGTSFCLAGGELNLNNWDVSKVTPMKGTS